MASQPQSTTGVIPTLHTSDGTKHIEWLKSVFNAEQTEIYYDKNKNIMHCAMLINKGYLYLCDKSCSMEEKNLTAEQKNSESEGLILHLELEDPDTFWKKSLSNGATVVDELKKRDWGSRYGKIQDPFGFVWGLMQGGDCRKPGVIPYMMVHDCEGYVEWATSALGGVVKDKFVFEEKIQHCSVEVNGGLFYMAEDLDSNVTSGKERISHVVCHINVTDPKAIWDRLLKNNAKTILDLKVQFWGDLYGTVSDARDYYWSICKVKPPPAKERGIISYIMSPDCKKQVAWIENVFGGKVEDTKTLEGGQIMHCKMVVNDGPLMLSDRLDVSQPDNPVPNPNSKSCEEKGCVLHLNVSDPDKIWKVAMENGGVEIVALKTQFWGDYYGQFRDPFGYCWSVSRVQ